MFEASPIFTGRPGLAAACAAALLAAVFSFPANAETLLNREQAAAVQSAIDADPVAKRAGSSCPADLYSRRAAERRGSGSFFSEEACLKDPAACHLACVIGRSGAACFELARAFQENRETVAPRYTQTLFALACAHGYGAGCTNRGAGLRNGGYDDDPLKDMPRAAKEACQFRSFRIACGREDAWGCAMLGQSYANGEGVSASRRLARRSYNKSCKLGPDFAACDFSKSGLRRIRR